MFGKTKLIVGLVLLATMVLLIQAAPVMAAGMIVSPSSGGFGTTFTLIADGFNPGEQVSFSVIAPNNVSVSSGTLKADRQGHIQESALIRAGSPAGTYRIIATGQSSHRQYSASFTVTGPLTTTTNPSTLAPAGLAVSPSIGNYSTTFTLTAGGFNPGESVSIWITTPTGAMIGPQSLSANNHGAVQIAGQVPRGNPSGTYTAYAQGLFSGHKYSGTFVLNVPIATFFPQWKGEYFSNKNLSGDPVVVRNDTSINFDWGLGSPDPAIPDNHFSVRWTRNVFFNAGTYTFTATTDDGMRVWVNGNLLIDAWFDQPRTTYNATITLAAGTYPLRVQYYDDTAKAFAQLSWAQTANIITAWTGSYYNNMTLSGSPVLIRQDAVLNFNWGGGSPGPGVPGTNWSAKWDSSQFAPSSGNYMISVTADDGVRVWVDGNLVINQWHDQPPTTYTVSGFLNAGYHSVHVEYYQHVGGSSLVLAFGAGG